LCSLKCPNIQELFPACFLNWNCKHVCNIIAFLSNQFNNCVLLNVQIFNSFFLHVFLIEIVNKHNGNIIATNGNNCFLTSCVTNLIRDK
jgi:hypothetical protein